MGFKMPGFSPFNKGQAYSPLTNTNNDGKENKDKKEDLKKDESK